MKIKLLIYLSIISRITYAQSYIISTVAGDSVKGYSGDGGIATNAELNGNFGVVVDDSGNIFIADRSNNRIRKVNDKGIISTYAGTGYGAVGGNGGFSGDGGQATLAEFYAPSGVALDDSGNLYIADEVSSHIRKINTNGIIYTVAGDSGGIGYSGDGGPATAAHLGSPYGVTVDNKGNIYIPDFYNNVVRKVNINGIISTIAGVYDTTAGYNGDGRQATTATLESPIAVALDDTGNIYIADSWNERIRKINTNGIISTVAGTGFIPGYGGFSGDGGLATSAELALPTSIALDKLGNLYIADESNSRIRRVNTNGIISTIAGNGTAGFSGDGGQATLAELNAPNGVRIDSLGDIFISDYVNNRVRKLTPVVTGINELSNKSFIKVYPNPSNGIFTFDLKGNTEQSTINIYDMLGENIYSTMLNAPITQIDLSGQPMGVYLYRITAKNGMVISNGKLVVQ